MGANGPVINVNGLPFMHFHLNCRIVHCMYCVGIKSIMAVGGS